MFAYFQRHHEKLHKVRQFAIIISCHVIVLCLQKWFRQSEKKTLIIMAAGILHVAWPSCIANKQ